MLWWNYAICYRLIPQCCWLWAFCHCVSSVTVVLWQKVNLTNNYLIFQNKIGVILRENNWRLIWHIIQYMALASSYWTTKNKGYGFYWPTLYNIITARTWCQLVGSKNAIFLSQRFLASRWVRTLPDVQLLRTAVRVSCRCHQYEWRWQLMCQNLYLRVERRRRDMTRERSVWQFSQPVTVVLTDDWLPHVCLQQSAGVPPKQRVRLVHSLLRHRLWAFELYFFLIFRSICAVDLIARREWFFSYFDRTTQRIV